MQKSSKFDVLYIADTESDGSIHRYHVMTPSIPEFTHWLNVYFSNVVNSVNYNNYQIGRTQVTQESYNKYFSETQLASSGMSPRDLLKFYVGNSNTVVAETSPDEPPPVPNEDNGNILVGKFRKD